DELRERCATALHARDLSLDLRQPLRERTGVARERRRLFVELREQAFGVRGVPGVPGGERLLLLQRRARAGERRLQLRRRGGGTVALGGERLGAPAFGLRLREERLTLARNLLHRGFAPAQRVDLLREVRRGRGAGLRGSSRVGLRRLGVALDRRGDRKSTRLNSS